MTSPFGVEHGYEIEKRGAFPAQGAKLQGLLKPYKGGIPKPDKKLPFQAAKVEAAVARRKGTTATPFGIPKKG